MRFFQVQSPSDEHEGQWTTSSRALGEPLTPTGLALERAMMKADELEFFGSANERDRFIPILDGNAVEIGRVMLGQTAIARSLRLSQSSHFQDECPDPRGITHAAAKNRESR
jgi:hypothetical protein